MARSNDLRLLACTNCAESTATACLCNIGHSDEPLFFCGARTRLGSLEKMNQRHDRRIISTPLERPYDRFFFYSAFLFRGWATGVSLRRTLAGGMRAPIRDCPAGFVSPRSPFLYRATSFLRHLERSALTLGEVRLLVTKTRATRRRIHPLLPLLPRP